MRELRGVGTGLLAGSVVGLTVLVEFAAVALSWGLEDVYDTVLYAVSATVTAGAGALVAARSPRHPVGWLLCGSALLNALCSDLAQGWGLRAGEHGWPGAAAGEWITAWSWLPSGYAWLLVFVLLPDGHLPRHRFRWVPAAGAAGLGLALPGWALDPDRGRDLSAGHNPVVLDGLPTDLLLAVGMALYLAALAGAVCSLLQRFRASTGPRRQQLRLVTAAVALTGVVLPGSFALWYVTPLARVGAAVVLTLLPIAIGVAILRYRLYDVDVLLERTVVYVPVSALLAAVYAGTVLLLGTALGRGSGWVTAAATLAVAVASRPARDRVQRVVDRRLHRDRFHALRRMEEFLAELRAGRTAPEEVQRVLRALLGDPDLRLLVHLPESTLLVDLDGVVAEPGTGDPGGAVHTPLQRGGRPLGVLVRTAAPDEDPALAPRLVAAAGLAIEIVRLRVELRRQLTEVRASRARIVAAAHRERRRIERDLHDGAQQRLVSIGLALRHAQHALGPGAPGDVADTLDAAVAEVGVTIQELRELARGLPPAQLDAGLAPAFEDLAHRAPVPVHLRVAAERYDRELEGAAWFIGCEGVTNAVKHARATRIDLDAARREGLLVVTVADDGVGGAAPGPGSGLSGLADRVAALGGVLRIDSRPGRGTRITAELPCAS